jgi:chromosome segregation ATPase
MEQFVEMKRCTDIARNLTILNDQLRVSLTQSTSNGNQLEKKCISLSKELSKFQVQHDHLQLQLSTMEEENRQLSLDPNAAEGSVTGSKVKSTLKI